MRALLFLLFVTPCISHAGGIYFSDRISGNSAVRAVDFGTTNSRLVGSASDPRGVVFDAVTSRAYCADRGLQQLNWYPAAGGAAQTQLTNLPNVADLCLDRVNRVFYWCEQSGGLIRKAPFSATGSAAVVGQTVYSGLTNPYYLDVDLQGARLFWAQDGANLYVGPLAGGAVPAPFYFGGVSNRGIAFDFASEAVYWCQRGAGVLADCGVYRRPLSGGAVQTLYGLGQASGTLVPDTPHGIVLDIPAGKVYWADTGTNAGSGFNERGVTRGDMDGSGPPEAFFPGTPGNQPWDLDLDRRTPSYAQWLARFFRLDAVSPVTDKLTDVDGDGVVNLAEYAFASRPWQGETSPLLEPLKVTDGGVDYGAVRFLRRIGAVDLTYRVQLSNNLKAWADNLAVQFGTPIPADDGMELVTFRSTVPINGNVRVFFRVLVESP